MRRDVLAYLNETGLSAEVLPLAPDGLAELVDLVADGTLSRNQAKDVLAECLREPKRPKQVVEERGLAQVSDEGALAAVVDAVLAANADVVDEYRAGDDKCARRSVVPHGRGDERAKGQGNPQVLNRLLDDRLHRRREETDTRPRFHCAMDANSGRPPHNESIDAAIAALAAAQHGVLARAGPWSLVSRRSRSATECQTGSGRRC